MLKKGTKEFKKLFKSGKLRFKNGNWYRGIKRIKWDKLLNLKCLYCKDKFLTRQEDQCCSMKCARKYYWKTLPFEKRYKTMKRINQHGYRFVRNEKGKLVAEHRYVMEKILNKKLTRFEHVHHINGNRIDNRPKNLMILSASGHNVIHKPSQSLKWNRNKVGKFAKFHIS